MSEYKHSMEEILKMPFQAFRQPHSQPVDMNKYEVFKRVQLLEGNEKPMYPVTNELDFASFCRKNDIPQGGIHIGIAGGLQPFLYQSIKGNSDLSIACDISPKQIDLLEDTLEMIALYDRKNFIETFTEKYHSEPYNGASKIRNVWSLFNDSDFEKLQKRIDEGKYKGVEGDFRHTGLPLALEIARSTGIPISLIYLSSIRDFAEYQAGNDRKKQVDVFGEFKKLDWLIQKNTEKENNDTPTLIRSDAMIIEYDTDYKNAAKHQKPRTVHRRMAKVDSNLSKSTPTRHIIIKG